LTFTVISSGKKQGGSRFFPENGTRKDWEGVQRGGRESGTPSERTVKGGTVERSSEENPGWGGVTEECDQET